MSPTGPKYAGTATDVGANPGVAAWTNPSNATGAPDTVLAQFPYFQGSTTNFSSNPLQLTNYSFGIPATAIVDGIVVSVTRSGVQVSEQVQLLKAGTAAGTPHPATFGAEFPGSLATVSFGSPTDLWGTTWLGSDINNTGFGVVVNSTETHDPADSNYNVDAASITVYWHFAPADVPKRYIYKVANSLGQPLGNLPDVMSDFTYSQDINTAGTNITVECAVSPDTSILPNDQLTDEAGNILTDESSNILTNEGSVPIFAPGASSINALIKDGNEVTVVEVGYWNPNGKVVFIGQIQHIEANFGGAGSNNSIKMIIYSDGENLDNYLVRGNPYTYTGDVTQTSENTSSSVTSSGASYNNMAQTWTVGAGVTNLGAISLLLFGTANVTINVYDGPAMINLMGSITQFVSVGSPTEVQFGFANTIVTVPASVPFFTVSVDSGQSITIYYQNTNVYGGGTAYSASYGGGGGGSYGAITGDLYFKTFSGTGSTTGTFTSQDPSTGMLIPIMNDYIARGGLITYNGSSIIATGESLSYGFNTNSVLEAVAALLTLAPDGFYWFADISTDILYFKQTSTGADITLTKGIHIDQLTLIFTIENLKNQAFFTGGLVSGANIYVTKSDTNSVALYGPRLDRISDNRITDTTTARQVATSDVLKNKDEQNQTTVTIVDKTMDTSLIKVGMTVGFSAFGTFVDGLILQIVTVNYGPEEVTLTLGVLPKRLTPLLENVTRGLLAQQTVANPTTPS